MLGIKFAKPCALRSATRAFSPDPTRHPVVFFVTQDTRRQGLWDVCLADFFRSSPVCRCNAVRWLVRFIGGCTRPTNKSRPTERDNLKPPMWMVHLGNRCMAKCGLATLEINSLHMALQAPNSHTMSLSSLLTTVGATAVNACHIVLKAFLSSSVTPNKKGILFGVDHVASGTHQAKNMN